MHECLSKLEKLKPKALKRRATAGRNSIAVRLDKLDLVSKSTGQSSRSSARIGKKARKSLAESDLDVSDDAGSYEQIDRTPTRKRVLEFGSSPEIDPVSKRR